MVDLNALASLESGKLLLLGNEAIVRGALEAGVKVVTAYPGTPSSEVVDTFYRIAEKTGVYVEYSVNEKVALEVAAGAAVSGVRALCSMKHVGLNVASDAFITLAYTGVRGGFLVVTADDPSCWSSQNEQDNRYYARLANIPMFEPSNSQEAKDMTCSALKLSEELELPVILRTTTRVSHTLAPVTLGPLEKSAVKGVFIKDARRFVMVPSNALVRHDVLLDKMKKAEEVSEGSEYNRVFGEGEEIGVIASGAAFNYAVEAVDKLGVKASILKLGLTHPLPSGKILNFLQGFDKVLVVEELEPILENDVRSIGFALEKRPKIYGKLTGHFPRSKEYSIEVVYHGVAASLGLAPPLEAKRQDSTLPPTPPRPPILCPGCPHRASLYAAKTTLGKEMAYCTDIGCYALGVQPPLEVGDILICMGASLGVASGISHALGSSTVAIVGDSTFFHASIPALINAVYNNHRIIVIVLDNLTTAMTGFQPHPGVEPTRGHRVMIEDVAQGCGVKYVKVLDPMNLMEARKALKEAALFEGPSVIVMRRACSVDERRKGVYSPPYVISKEKCNKCLACVKVLGCPAFHLSDGELKIDEVLCSGCGLCVYICPVKAVEPSR
ncbi:MAG: indolepyruvate ferredoxin oxidoreductase subunit alpha [Candidatus Bathyarchaeia archaeon]